MRSGGFGEAEGELTSCTSAHLPGSEVMKVQKVNQEAISGHLGATGREMRHGPSPRLFPQIVKGGFLILSALQSLLAENPLKLRTS